MSTYKSAVTSLDEGSEIEMLTEHYWTMLEFICLLRKLEPSIMVRYINNNPVLEFSDNELIEAHDSILNFSGILVDSTISKLLNNNDHHDPNIIRKMIDGKLVSLKHIISGYIKSEENIISEKIELLRIKYGLIYELEQKAIDEGNQIETDPVLDEICRLRRSQEENGVSDSEREQIDAKINKLKTERKKAKKEKEIIEREIYYPIVNCKFNIARYERFLELFNAENEFTLFYLSVLESMNNESYSEELRNCILLTVEEMHKHETLGIRNSSVLTHRIWCRLWKETGKPFPSHLKEFARNIPSSAAHYMKNINNLKAELTSLILISLHLAFNEERKLKYENSPLTVSDSITSGRIKIETLAKWLKEVSNEVGVGASNVPSLDRLKKLKIKELDTVFCPLETRENGELDLTAPNSPE